MKAIMLTAGIYPLSGGRELGTFGYCIELSKVVDLKIFSILDRKYKLDDAYAAYPDLNVDYCYSQGYSSFFMEGTFHFTSLLKAKFSYLRPIYREYLSRIENYLKDNTVEYVIIDHVMMALYCGVIKKKFPNVKFIYNSHNIEYLNTFSEYYDNKVFKNDIIGKLKKKIYYNRCMSRKNVEFQMIKDSVKTFCISRGDIAGLAKEFGYEDRYLFAKPLINFSPVKTAEDMEANSKKLLIVGSMNWYPNVKGTIWFIENVFVKLYEHDCTYELYIVGRNPDSKLIELGKRYVNIVVTGSVPDTSVYFKECAVSIVPVFEGTGAKIKVLESIARHIPTVSSNFAAKDYEPIEGVMLVADTANDFIDTIEAITNSREIRMKLYAGMTEYYNTYFELSEDIKSLFL